MSQKKLLLVRMDKIGDLVLTLGVDQHPELHGYTCTWLLPESLEFVIQAAQPQRRYHLSSKSFSWKNFGQLFSWLRQQSFAGVVFFQGPKWLPALFWLARIPLRIGPRSHLLSWCFFNRGLRQSRSTVEHSEFYYNQKLLEYGLRLSSLPTLPPTQLQPPPSAGLTREYLQGLYYVVHAGMGGSALNWPQERYIEVVEVLLAEGHSVVLTGTESDRVYLDKILSRLHSAEGRKLYNEVGQLSGPQLLLVLAKAKAVLAPSTGVLHLAASLGSVSVGIYPPVRVQSPKRWGAYGFRAQSLAPKVDCPEFFRCQGDRCQYYPCMDSITSEQVVGELKK